MTESVFAVDATYRRRNVALLLAEQNPLCVRSGGFTLYKCGVYFHYAPLGHYPIWQGTASVVRGLPVMRVTLTGGPAVRYQLLSEKEMSRDEVRRIVPKLNAIETFVMNASGVDVRDELPHVERDGFNRRRLVDKRSPRPGHDDYFAIASGF